MVWLRVATSLGPAALCEPSAFILTYDATRALTACRQFILRRTGAHDQHQRTGDADQQWTEEHHEAAQQGQLDHADEQVGKGQRHDRGLEQGGGEGHGGRCGYLIYSFDVTIVQRNI